MTEPDPYVGVSEMRQAEFRSIWAGCILRNDRIRAVLPITFRPLDDSVRDRMVGVVGRFGEGRASAERAGQILQPERCSGRQLAEDRESFDQLAQFLEVLVDRPFHAGFA